MPELRIGVLTCSDSRAAGAEDDAGIQLIQACEDKGWFVIDYHVCPDDAETICASLAELADADEADVVFTLGGTGLGSRDITPEATEMCVERIVPGIAEAIRACDSSPRQEHILSRATAGIRGHTLIINLPGGLAPTLEAFEIISQYLPVAKEHLNGNS